MNHTVTGRSARKRKLDLDLFLSNLNLGIRSRQGFNALLAWSRVGGVALILLRFWLSPTNITALDIALFILGLLYSLSVALSSNRLMSRFDAPTFHLILVVIDTVMVSYFVHTTGYPATDLFLFYFLPLATASHFLERKRLLVIGPSIVLAYLLVLWLEGYNSFTFDVMIPWLVKSAFLLAGTWILRAKRSLPNTDEAWVVSPSVAREKLEKLLRGARDVLPYDTASVQLVYRDRLMIVACDGFPNPDEILQIEFPVDDENFPNHSVIRSRQVRVEQADKFESFKDRHFYANHIKSWMGVPLISPSTGECFGMISIDSSQADAYNQFDAVQAGWFAKKVSSFLVEAALGPAAMTLATHRENLLGSLKSWGDLLPDRTSKWDDDVQAAKELIQIGQKIFRTEDCSIFFLRHKFGEKQEEPVLHLICSTAVPQNYFQKHEMKVTGRHGDGLTGLAVHRNKTLNYGAAKVKRSPYRANFIYHLKFLFSGKSRQVMITPLRDFKGNAVGAIKIENRMGTSSEKEFFPVEKNLFEIYASMTSLILETIRQKSYASRLDEGVHGMRGVIHHAAIVPIEELLNSVRDVNGSPHTENKLLEIKHALEYVKMTIHGILADSADNIYLEKEGLLHAVRHYLKSLQAIPFFESACNRITISDHNTRDDEMPYQIQEIFFNVAKEGILNIVRHSKIEQKVGGFGEVSFLRKDGVFEITIRDNGIGFVDSASPDMKKRSFGLNAIKGQMELKKYHSQVAVVNIHSTPGEGTTVQAQWAL